MLRVSIDSTYLDHIPYVDKKGANATLIKQTGYLYTVDPTGAAGRFPEVAVVASSSPKPVALSGDHPGTKEDRPASKPESVQPQSIDEDPEPFEKKLVHLSGVMRMGGRVLYTFTLSQGGARVLDMTLDEVKSAGYSYRSTGDCTGVLIWKNIRRAVMCDAPRLTTGEKSMPVVVAIPGVSPRT